MQEPPSNRCGYTWPEDYDPGFTLSPNLELGIGAESCCYRKSLSDTDYCAWHANPRDTEKKTIESLREARAPTDIRELNSPFDELLDGAQLPDMKLTDVFMIGENSLENCSLREGNFQDSELESWDLRSAHLWQANLKDVSLWGTNLSEANLSRADFIDSFLSGAKLEDVNLRRSNLTSANLRGAQLSNADLTKANLTNAELNDAQLDNTDLTKATFTDASLQHANLSHANLERATMVRADLFDAILPNAKMEGVLFADARVNEGTFQNLSCEENQSGGHKFRDWCKNLILGPEGLDHYRCSYDPKISKEKGEDDSSELNNPEVRAGGVYLELERLAGTNALQKWQSRFFILRQDMHLYKLKRKNRYTATLYQSVQKSLFGYGERFSRVIGWSIGIILLFSLTYLQGGWIRPVQAEGTLGPAISWSRLSEGPGVIWESVYYSTLTFTALGFGDFRPTTSIGQFFTITETAIGAVMIALLVFVMGRRASR